MMLQVACFLREERYRIAIERRADVDDLHFAQDLGGDLSKHLSQHDLTHSSLLIVKYYNWCIASND